MTTVRGRLPDGRTVEVDAEGEAIAAVREVSPFADDPWLAPGFIDLQVNGYGGFDVNGDQVGPDAVAGMAHALAGAGTTSFAPTVITASETTIHASLAAIVAARESDPAVAAAIPLIHVEGPHLSDQEGPRGVHPVEQIRPPDLAEFDRWQATARGLIGIVTISAHWPGAPDYTRGLVARGVRVAIGHTHAGPEQLTAVVDD
ncbi:MAG: N-acetylglucosamine-6-phosphate deacetylase, partial [Propionibacteriaceae bacterium]|nr:N-acetylglucosamine-6-phosphate deacetylase [Propionibacteriaceae bacterium]